MTSPALWLARRELAARGRRVALAGAVVAAIAASVTATELVARAREAAVAAQVDAMGPALTIVPRGTTAGELARYELSGALPASAEAAVRRALGARLRAVEERIVLHREIRGRRRLVIGAEAIPGADPAGGRDVAVVGSELGRSITAGSTITIDGREYEVARVLPSAGSIEDLAVFVRIAGLRALGVNELRVFLAAGASPRDAEALLVRAAPGLAVIRSDRGEVADGALPESLARHRAVAYAVMAAVAALTLMIAAHLDTTERSNELATLVAIGASVRTILGGLLARSAAIAGAGGAVGALAGAAIATTLGSGLQALSTWVLVAAVVAAAVCVGVVAAAPTAFWSAAQDPVRELQEG